MSKVQAKLAAQRAAMAASLIERDAEVDLVLTGMICRENVLLVGPPGTAKSLLCDALVDWMDGEKFSVLLTKYTAPEEVFGPVSLAALKRDEYKRIITGKLPTANIAFIDEIFKASSAILNTLLKILNERTFQNNGTLIHCPLQLAVAASNEWPDSNEGGKELGALFDRFLLRKTVNPISSSRGVDRLLWDDVAVESSETITPEEIDTAAAESAALPWSDSAKAALVQIIETLRSEGIRPGDRRLRKTVNACRAFCYLNGGSEVETDHLEIAAHTLWDSPEQAPTAAKVVAKIANPAGARVASLVAEATEVIANTDTRAVAQCIAATEKLREIASKLRGIKGARAKAAFEYVSAEGKKIHLASVKGFD